MAFLHTSSGQKGTLAGLEDRAQEQTFDLTQKVHRRTPNILMMTWKVLCALLKKKKYPNNWVYFDLDSFLRKEENDQESEML